MKVRRLSENDASGRLAYSLTRVQDVDPDFAASPLLTKAQRKFLIILGVVLLIGLITAPLWTVVSVLSIVTASYLAATVYRASLFVASLRSANSIHITAEEARAVPIEQLPVYTVLVPAYREPEVIGKLVGHLTDLDYPTKLLDIKFLLEEDDDETIAAVRAEASSSHMEAVLVPPSEPRTKPKALNFGLSLARGEIVTIFDAEDQPDPLQLRRAALALSRSTSDVACVQARLSFGNVGQNLITKWFSIEYAMWFTLFLPGLVEMRAPLPLGGTSNHFRRSVLEEIGAWDPHNVTEDADLGIRLARVGYRCEVLDSVTLEEANSDFINWVKQRSRWYKGYLQTFLIHMRHPVQLYRQLGWRGYLGFFLFVGGTPLLALLNPLFWLMTGLWFAGDHTHVVQELFPAPLFYPAAACWVFGNFVAAYLTVLACRLVGQEDLIGAALLVPLYWVMMAVAAAKAGWQLVANPTFWEKTVHGLTQEPAVHDSEQPQERAPA